MDWGAFAGGAAKGLVAGAGVADQYRRTAIAEEEMGLRRQANQRAMEDQAYQQEQREKQRAFQEDLKKAAMILKNPDGSDVDVGNMKPEDRAELFTRFSGELFAARVRHGQMDEKSVKEMAALQKELSNEKNQKLIRNVLATGNFGQLKGTDFEEFADGRIEIRRGPMGIEEKFFVGKDGKQGMPLHVVYGLLGQEKAAAAERAAIDDARMGKDAEMKHSEAKERIALTRDQMQTNAAMRRDSLELRKAQVGESQARTAAINEQREVGALNQTITEIQKAVMPKPTKDKRGNLVQDETMENFINKMIARKVEEVGAKSGDLSKAQAKIISEIKGRATELDTKAKQLADQRYKELSDMKGKSKAEQKAALAKRQEIIDAGIPFTKEGLYRYMRDRALEMEFEDPTIDSDQVTRRAR